MAVRASLPGELLLDAILVDSARQLDILLQGLSEKDYARPRVWDPATLEHVKRRGTYVALRWVLNPALGIPLVPFTVWRRPVVQRDAAKPIDWHRTGNDTLGWDGVTEVLRIEIDVTAPVTASGLQRADLQPVQTVSGAAGTTLVLDAGPMLGVRVDNPAAISALRGQSLVLLANGAGWQSFEVVGLPFGPDLVGATYYSGAQQGLVGSLTDPVTAALQRLTNWGPVLGWAPLAGVPPWQAPEPKRLIDEVRANVLPDLAQVMIANGPPLVDQQIAATVAHQFEALRQVVGARSRTLNTGALADKSEITVRPLQSLAISVATDTWASLALGFGTGDAPPTGDVAQKGGYDYMVTTEWDGMLSVAVQQQWPWPFGAPLPAYITEEVKRELAAVVLAPQPRSAPAAPTPLVASFGHDEGADAVDEPYHVSTVLQTTRTDALPKQPRASGYSLARYDKPGVGAYQMREHPMAKGWIPIGSAAPAPNPGDPPDPNLLPGTVTLRNSGVPRPISGAPNVFEYFAAAADLFGQWSPWIGAWYTQPAAAVQAPVVATVKARAVAGAGNSDPCSLAVTGEITWNIRERSLHRLRIAVDVYVPTPPPPTAYDEPPPVPQGGTVTIADLMLTYGADGTPAAPPAGVTVSHVHDDDTPVTAGDPAVGDDRRYKIVFSNLAVTFGLNHELAVVLYAQAEETVRPGEWSGWTHTREIALASNPIPPPAPAPLPLVYPEWASLPDAAGLSYTSIRWTPTGAWRYRVYEATEAALRAACSQSGPVLTDGFAERMQALFDLYKNPSNLPKLKAAFRKLGTDPVLPPIEADGTMRFESLLPRGSSLIHCYIVAAVSEANVVSSWPEPDANGRKAFRAYAIPHPLRPALPQISATLDGAAPLVTVQLQGSVATTSIRLYRAANAILARSTGTMVLVATVPAGSTAPDFWKKTKISDPAAPVSWRHLQYRTVALTIDDPERGGMAVPSEASRAFALLNPPPTPPTLTLTPNVAGTTSSITVIRVDTDALRSGSDIGDFAVYCVVTATNTAPFRFSSSLGTIPEIASIPAFVAGTETAGYIGSNLYLRLARSVDQALGLTVDVTDPLGRTTRASIPVLYAVPDPAPVISLAANRLIGIVRLRIGTNVTLPPDPAHDWQLQIVMQRVLPFPPVPPVSHTFAISSIPTIASEAAMPNPVLDPAAFEIRRVDHTGLILMWSRSTMAVRVGVRLTNPAGQTTSVMQVVT